MTAPLIPIDMLLATTAKVLCSAVFISGRDPEEAFRNSAPWALHRFQLPEALTRLVRWRVDRERGQVEVSLDLDRAAAEELVAASRAAYPDFDADWETEIERLATLQRVQRSARHVGDQGCLIVPEDGELQLHFTPVRLARGPIASTGWPAVGRDAAAVAADGAKAVRHRVDLALASAFADAEACHAAILVVHRGQIVGEGYADGLTADMPLESWSMGKTVLATLIGLLVGQGMLELDAPAPVASWRKPDDPRSAITLRHLLNMSSGLRCHGPDESRQGWPTGLPEHFYPYGQAIDVEAFATQREPEFAPATVGRYRNCDTLTLATIFERTVRERLGADPLSWPQTELFDRLGMYGLTHETDRWGRFIMSGFNYGTARDWARLGQLYLQQGVWQGARILPEDWVTFARIPAPAWKEKNYGAQLWLNSTGEFPLPEDAFFMAGGGGQYVFVVPSMECVIVRMGHARGFAKAKQKVDALLKDLVGMR